MGRGATDKINQTSKSGLALGFRLSSQMLLKVNGACSERRGVNWGEPQAHP